jgi:hypothetical protein
MQPGEGILPWMQIKGFEMSSVSSPPGEQITSALQCDLFELERAVTETRTSLRATLQEQAPWVKAFRNSFRYVQICRITVNGFFEPHLPMRR